MIGIQYSDFLKMDIRQLNNSIEGYIDRRENQLNDNQSLLKTEASLISLAVWGSDKFNRKLEPIRLRGKSRAAKLANALNNLGVQKDGLSAYFESRRKRLNGKQ